MIIFIHLGKEMQRKVFLKKLLHSTLWPKTALKGINFDILFAWGAIHSQLGSKGRSLSDDSNYRRSN